MLAQHEKDTLPCWLQEQSAVRYTKYEGILQAAEQKVAMNMKAVEQLESALRMHD